MMNPSESSSSARGIRSAARSPVIAAVTLAATFVGVTLGRAETITVPADFPSIQAAIAVAASGDCVLVDPGIYEENLDFQGKAITVRGWAGSDRTHIDASNSSGAAVSFVSGEDSRAVISGFTLTGGEPGIACVDASPTIEGCAIVKNCFAGNGAGVRLENSSALLRDCTIARNHAFDGGGVWTTGSGEVTLTGCEIVDNTATAGGGIVCGGSFVLADCTIARNHGTFLGGGVTVPLAAGTIMNCRIEENTTGGYGAGLHLNGDVTVIGSEVRGNMSGETGGGVVIHNDTALVECLIWQNTSVEYGGGVYCSGGTTTVLNCTVTNNTGGGGTGLATKDFPGVPTDVTVTNCIFWDNGSPHYAIEIDPNTKVAIRYTDAHGGYPGEAVIDVDPLFIDPQTGNFHLQTKSPCIDAGDPDGRRDPDGSVADLGAFPLGSEPGSFRRGDADANGDVNGVTDTVFLLTWGFTGGSPPPCLDAADVDDNGAICPLLDPFALMRWAFADGPPPPKPGTRECGLDPSADRLLCEHSPAC